MAHDVASGTHRGLSNSLLLDIINRSPTTSYSGESAAERWWRRRGVEGNPRQRVYLDDLAQHRKHIYQQPPDLIRVQGLKPENHSQMNGIKNLLKDMPHTPGVLLLDATLFQEGWQDWLPLVKGMVEIPQVANPEHVEAFVATLGTELQHHTHLAKAVELACASTLPTCRDNLVPATRTQDSELYVGSTLVPGDQRLWHTRFQILVERLTPFAYPDVQKVLAERFASQSTVGWLDQIGALIQELRGLPGRALPQDLGRELNTLETRLKEGIHLTPEFVKSEARTLADHYLHLWFDILQAMVNTTKGPVILGEDLWPTQLSPRHQKALETTLQQELVSDEGKLRGWFTQLGANLLLAGHQIYLPAGLVLDLGAGAQPSVQPLSTLSTPLARTA